MTAFDPRVFAGSLTQRPGTYQMLDGKGRVIYVGKARNLRKRVASYFGGRPLDAKTMAMVARVADIRVTVTATEADALMLEYNLIKRHKPRFNVVLRDDKSYPYIRVRTDKAFPQVSFYRGSRRAAGRLFGPYPSAGSVRETLNQIQKLFQVRQCEDSYFSHRQRPCLQYQIQRCTAPCVGLVSAEDYRRDLEHAMMFLQGRSEAITQVLVKRMEDASAELNFERAAQYRDQIAKLKSVEAQQLVTRSRGDLDAIGLVSDGGVNCVAVMSFRGGRLLGSRSHFPRAADGTNPREIMRGFLLQYYGRREPPHEIVTSHPVSDVDALAELFAGRAGRKVQIKHRVRGDRAAWVEMVLTNAAHSAAARKRSGVVIARQFRSLGDCLELEEIPQRLACFDVSHTSGESTVASCVVFGLEGAMKSEYRRFNIAGITAGDDYAALTQALERWCARLTRAEAGVPDVLFIDGGSRATQRRRHRSGRTSIGRDAPDRSCQGTRAASRPGAAVCRRPPYTAQVAVQHTCAVPGSTIARRSASVRCCRAPGTASQAAHGLAAGRDPGRRPQAAARVAAPVRRSPGGDARRSRRPGTGQGHFPPSGQADIRACTLRLNRMTHQHFSRGWQEGESGN